MNELIITVKSGFSAGGFRLEVPGKFKKDYAYGYDASWSKEQAERAAKDVETAKKNNWKSIPSEKPYVSDIIASIMKEFNIDPENVNVAAGENTFKGTSISRDKVQEFIDDYLGEAFEIYNRG